MDDFYEPLSNATSASTGVSSILNLLLEHQVAVTVTVLLAPIILVIATRLLSERPSEQISGRDGKTVWMLPYWLPIVGHAFQILYDPVKLMTEARDQSSHGIFALNLGMTTHNIISDPSLVKGVMQQKESVLQFWPIAWSVLEKFFGFPKKSKPKYEGIWDELISYTGYLMKEPHLSNMLTGTINGLQENIPQMISFMESEIDQQPWERWAKASYVSDSETEINLMSLMRDMMGHASVPGLFGRGLLDKYPDILHDVYDMDAGMIYLMIGLPPWTPWLAVNRAHRARQRVWRALDDHQRALDASADGKPFDSTWGDLDDVSAFIMKRHAIFQNNGFEIKDRGDISILWALIINSNLLVYWHILHILATPGLLARIRTEIAPYVQINDGEKIGNFSSPSKLKISHEGLSKKCPLFKSTYLETLRTSNQPWSVRQVADNIVISGDKKAANPNSFFLKKGEYITIPHDLHMRDPRYFKDPDKFDPERFLVRGEDGSLSIEIGTMRPYGGGPSMCKGRVFAERECLALVAGVLAFWDIEPADKKVGWVIPEQKKSSAISLPVHETRVRIRPRRFEWD